MTTTKKKRGVIAMSAGNHAQAVAYHARRFGIPATIVMSQTTPLVKIENTRKQGAHIVLYGETLYDSAIMAREIAAAEGLVLIHPYDDPAVMAGQGTVAMEMLAEAPDLDVLIIPVGGPTLAEGIAVKTVGELTLPVIRKLDTRKNRSRLDVCRDSLMSPDHGAS